MREKGFDAIEPDNMDGYENSTGFPLTAAEQLSYNEWVAGEAHAWGWPSFRRTTANRPSQLEPYFDGALDEQCNQYHECSCFQPYLAAGKPVLNAEYSLATELVLRRRQRGRDHGSALQPRTRRSSFEPCW